jgi:transcriptional regulator
MYLPDAFRKDSGDFVARLLYKYPLGTIVSMLNGELWATPLPFIYDADRGPHGTLTAHLARENPHWQAFDGTTEALVMFMGPNAYVSPQWYESPVNAGTWNYATVHVYGAPRIVSETDAMLALMERFVQHYEGRFATPRGINLQEERKYRLLGRIVGIEVPITRVQPKAQMNQNRSLTDQRLVAEHLATLPHRYCQSISTQMFENVAAVQAALAGQTSAAAAPAAAPLPALTAETRPPPSSSSPSSSSPSSSSPSSCPPSKPASAAPPTAVGGAAVARTPRSDT